MNKKINFINLTNFHNPKLLKKVVLFAILTLIVAVFNTSSTVKASSGVSVIYGVHVQTYGDQPDVVSTADNIMTAGTSGESKRLERIHIKVNGVDGLHIQYRVHVQNIGWMPWCSDGEDAGTAGFSKRLEGIQIQLTGTNADKYSVYYRVHAQNVGWMNWAKDGEDAGTAGYSRRLEGIQIVVLPKGKTPSVTNPTNDTSKAYENKYGATTPYCDPTVPHIVYEGHVQTYGDQLPTFDGAICGTSGEGKRVESFKIRLTNVSASGYAGSGVTYMTHVQGYGDRPWVANGALSGSQGESKRVEAIYIKLTGSIANDYSVSYMSHAQGYGDLAWVKDGALSGTSGESKRLEYVRIKLVKKSNSGDNPDTPTGDNTTDEGGENGNSNSNASTCKHKNLITVEEEYVVDPNPDPILTRSEGVDMESSFSYYGCHRCGMRMYHPENLVEWTEEKKQAHLKECGGELRDNKSFILDRVRSTDEETIVKYYDTCSKCNVAMIDGFTASNLWWLLSDRYNHSDGCGIGFATYGSLCDYRWHDAEYEYPDPVMDTLNFNKCKDCGLHFCPYCCICLEGYFDGFQTTNKDELINHVLSNH